MTTEEDKPKVEGKKPRRPTRAYNKEDTSAMAGLEEAPATVERCKDSTGVFLQRGHKVAPEALAKAPDPGRILDAIRQHNANGPAVSLGKKLSAKWSARLNEVIATFGTKTFADIGRRVVRTLRAPA